MTAGSFAPMVHFAACLRGPFLQHPNQDKNLNTPAKTFSRASRMADDRRMPLKLTIAVTLIATVLGLFSPFSHAAAATVQAGPGVGPASTLIARTECLYRAAEHL